MEVPQVFEDTHGLLLELVGKRAVTGLRIDHPDGLCLPNEYFEKLQRRCAEVLKIEAADDRRAIYMVLEKILTGTEPLRERLAGPRHNRLRFRESGRAIARGCVRRSRRSRKPSTASSATRFTLVIWFTRRSASSCVCRSRTTSMFSATCSIVSRSKIAGIAITRSMRLAGLCAKRSLASRFIGHISRPARR